MIPKYSCLSDVQADLKSDKLTCQELVNYYLEQAERSKELNAYIELYAAAALEKAKRIDAQLQSSPEDLGKCFGLVISVKDVICQKGKEVTAASGILQGFTSMFSATAIDRLESAGAIVIGRVNCDQFGMGSSNENSVYGPVRNADDPSRIPGGSSGGSAVSVQIDSCLIAIGSDTGGSIRQPAGFCGLYGLKPTYGRISRHGLLAYASSFDQIGFIGRSASDLALMLAITSGTDGFDASLVDSPAWNLPKSFDPLPKKKIAVLETAMQHPGMDKEIQSAHELLLKKLVMQGYECTSVPMDLLDYIVPTYYTLTTAEASANLSRYDGIRYGTRVKGEDLSSTYTVSRTEGFSTEVKRRVLLGTFVLSAGYYDAYYGKAQKIRALLKQEIDRLFQEYELILMPVSPVPAWKIGEKGADPTELYLADIFTVLANLVGVPALTIPLGEHSNGTKFGFQVLAPTMTEENIFSFAAQFQNPFIC